MINKENVTKVRFGYYLIEKRIEEKSDSSFVMLDEDNTMFNGIVISSGEKFYSNGIELDMDFFEGDEVLFRKNGSIKVKSDSELYLVPHENVFLSVDNFEEEK